MDPSHLADCGLFGGPPTVCTCGASPLFKMFEYRISYDVFGWQRHSRESLVATRASAALARLYAIPGGARVKPSLFIRRAVLDAFVPAEVEAIARNWAATWEPEAEGFLECHGILDVVCALDGSPLPGDLRAQLATLPTEDEIKAALRPWCEYWAAQS